MGTLLLYGIKVKACSMDWSTSNSHIIHKIIYWSFYLRIQKNSISWYYKGHLKCLGDSSSGVETKDIQSLTGYRILERQILQVC